ncbi:MAG: glycosyltransferase [Candidatus Micrarchaeia archaeon]
MTYKPKRSTIRLITVLLFTLLAAAGVIFSVYLFMVSTNLYMYLIAFAFLVLSVVSGFFNVFAAYWYYRAYFYPDHIESIKKSLKPMETLPTVAVAVPTYNESPKTVERTLRKLLKLNYPKGRLKYYLLDDSNKQDIAKALEAFCSEHGIVYLHRDSRRGFKAGALNDAIKISKEELMAIFDADEYLINNNFLIDLVPYFQDEKLSYVQTEKRSAKGNFFSDSVDLFNAFFFKFIQTARALDNTAIFAGSCGIIRKSILERIGGFPEYVIEDTFFSFESDEGSFRSLYIPKVYALGRPIKTFTALAKQQWRYNYGDTQFLAYLLHRLRKKKNVRNLTTLSSMDYIAHGFGLNYLSLILIIFTLVSVLIVFSSFPMSRFTFSQIGQLLQLKSITLYLQMFGIVAFTLSLLIPVLLTKFYFNSIRKGVMIFILNFALAFVRLKAAIAAMLRLDPRLQWQKVGKSNRTLIASVLNTKFEIMFSTILMVLGYISIAVNDNTTGGLWLIGYGSLYVFSTLFFYKYG